MTSPQLAEQLAKMPDGQRAEHLRWLERRNAQRKRHKMPLLETPDDESSAMPAVRQAATPAPKPATASKPVVDANPPPAPAKPKVNPKSLTRKEPACKWRGSIVGTAYCACSGSPDAFSCLCPDVAEKLCTLHASSRPVQKIIRPEDPELRVNGSPKPRVCAVCEKREA